jgi:predicted protein tyrosine phosphatase
MIPVIDRLYLGNREMAKDLRRLKEGGITHIVNCADELPNYHPAEFRYLALRMKDPDPGLAAHIPTITSFVDEGRREGRVLVHCFAGVSRSPAVILAYLCHHTGEPLHAAARRMAAAVWTNPDLLFLAQIAAHLNTNLSSAELDGLSRLLCGRPLED